MTTDEIYEEHGSDWSHQVSAVRTTRWLQRDQTLPLSAKVVACETSSLQAMFSYGLLLEAHGVNFNIRASPPPNVTMMLSAQKMT